jgi:ABC-type amino acid transport substrate-binding protein
VPSRPNRRTYLLVAGSLLALGWSGCRAPAPLAPALVVASDLDNPPFAELAEDGTPRGRDVEMMNELARRLGRPLEWRRQPFDRLLASVAAGEVDLVCATLGITPERRQLVRFSRPYYLTELAVVVRAGPGEPKGFTDLQGRRVGASPGTTSERALGLRLPEALPDTNSPKGVSVTERLLSAELDAFILDGPNANALVENSTGRLVRLPEALESESYALALPPDAAELTRQVDRILADLEREGYLLLLDTRYGLVTAAPR